MVRDWRTLHCGLRILYAFSSQSIRVIKSENSDMGGDVSGMGGTRRVWLAL